MRASLQIVLGRAAPSSPVDVDLCIEARSPTVSRRLSRRQAVIKLKSDCRFYLLNPSRRLIFVNGCPVDRNQRIRLADMCLVEIVGVRFIFEINTRLLNQIKQQLAEDPPLSTTFVPGAAAPSPMLRHTSETIPTPPSLSSPLPQQSTPTIALPTTEIGHSTPVDAEEQQRELQDVAEAQQRSPLVVVIDDSTHGDDDMTETASTNTNTTSETV